MRLHFLGAAETVTGSKYLLEDDDVYLLVDCGLFQGLKKLRLKNWQQLPLDYKRLTHVLLTHGHLDHTGFLPRLTKLGFEGPILGTKPTLALAEIILRDSAKIQEEEAERANEAGYSKHHPAQPLYTIRDVEKTLGQFQVVEDDQWLSIGSHVKARWQRNGHILGSTFIEIEKEGKRIVFSGDIGRTTDPLMPPPKQPTKADVLVIETTYGHVCHPKDNPQKVLRKIIGKVIGRQGTLLISSFAVERAQLMIYFLWQLRLNKQLPHVPIILDSPMSSDVLSVFTTMADWHRLPRKDIQAMIQGIIITESFQETLMYCNDPSSKIVIAGSGMLTGGRILTYLQHYAGDPKAGILLAGFQAQGTRGRQLLEGTQELKIYGQYYPVAAETFHLQALSAHADQSELLSWLNQLPDAPQHVFLTHGEPHAADAFRRKLRDVYGWHSQIPSLYDVVEC